MQHSCIPLSDERSWNNALEGMDVPYVCLHAYCAWIACCSGLETFLYVGTEGTKRVVCPLSIRSWAPDMRELVSPYGFGGFIANFPWESYPAFGDEWRFFCRSEGFVTAYIMQHPRAPLPVMQWGDMLQAHHMLYCVDATESETQLWKQLCSTHRYEIRRVEKKSEIEILTDKERLAAALVDLYPQTFKRVQASDVYDFSADDLHRLADQNGVLLVGAQDTHGIQAVAVFLMTGYSAEYFLNASTVPGRAYTRNLVWTALRMMKRAGTACVNLGGGIRSGDSLDDFKRRFGGTASCAQILKVIIDQEKYRAVCRCADVNMQTAYFPPYWAPKREKVL